MKINLKEWKKIKDEADHTVMENKDGHQMKIAHKALSKDYLKKLKALPSASKDDAKESKKTPMKKDEDKVKPTKDGKVVRLNKGGDVPAPEAAIAPTSMPDSPPMDAPAPDKQPVTININAAQPGQPLPPVPVAAQPANQIPGVQEAPQPSPLTPPQQIPAAATPEPQPAAQERPINPFEQQALYGAQAAGQQLAAAELQAQAKTQEGQAEEKALATKIGAAQEVNKKYQGHLDSLNAETEQAIKDFKDHDIDYHRYLGNMSTGSKIQAAIGVMVSGLGAGLAGQSNQALDFINKQIERDIEQQKAQLGQKETLVGAYMKQFGNVHDAATMATNFLQMQAADQIQLAASKAKSPLAQAALMNDRAKIIAEIGQRNADLATKQMLGNVYNAPGTQGSQQSDAQVRSTINYLRLAGHEDQAKQMEQHWVPGVGVAGTEVPLAARDNITAKQILNNELMDFKTRIQRLGTIDKVDPRNPELNALKTKAAEIQSLYRNAINGGVFKKGEQEFIDTIIDSDPSKFFADIRVLPKLDEVMKSNTSQLNVLKKQYDLPVQQENNKPKQFSKAQQLTIDAARANVKHKNPQIAAKAKAVLDQAGISY